MAENDVDIMEGSEVSDSAVAEDPHEKIEPEVGDSGEAEDSQENIEPEVDDSVVAEDSQENIESESGKSTVELKDSVVSGDVNINVGTLTTPTVSGEAQTIVMNPYATGGQVIMVGQPSSAPGFIGVVCIVLGAFSVLGIGLAFMDAVDPETGEKIVVSMKMKVFNSFASAVSAVTLILGGIWLKNRQRRGVHMLWISVVLSFILSIIGFFMGGDSAIAEATGNRLSSNQALGIGIAFEVVCNAICFVLVSIPLMVSNSGLDDSSLFSSNDGNDYVKQY